MEPQIIIARRIARELKAGMLVNLGIGIPTAVANYIPEGLHVFFQSENGLIGTGAPPQEGMAHPMLTDAGGRPVTALPGASTFDSAMSFGLIRGGHLDLTVLGGLQVDQTGQLANWMIPGKMVPGMGGASAGGFGLGGILTATGVGTPVQDGKQVINVAGKTFLVEAALRADFALVHAFVADYLGNLGYALTARNFNPVIAMAADTVIVSAENIVPVGVIPPDHVITPAPVVDYLVTNP